MKNFLTNLGLFLSLSLFPLLGKAYDFEVDGFYYNITSQSNLEVEVTYGQIEKYYTYKDSGDYFSNYAYRNNSYSGNIIIPETVNYNNRTYTVTKIGFQTFGISNEYKSNNYNSGWVQAINKGCLINSIVIPNTVKVIDNFAFNASAIEEIILPNSILSIGNYCFSNCEQLSSVKLSSYLTTIPSNAFGYCINLKDVRISDSVKRIEYNAFQECKSLSYVIIGKSVEFIDYSSFYSCPNLLEVFYTSPNKPEGRVYATNSNMESYVPSSKVYEFGKDYVTFSADQFPYTGAPNNVEWTNNIKYLTCDIKGPVETQINAGEYTDMITANYSGDVNLSVEIPYQYTINPAPLTLSVNDVEREYGDPNPTFTCTASGFVNGENLSNIGVTPTYECEATQLSNVGSYRILAQLDAKNYSITYNYGNLKITPAPISVTVEPSVKIYGDSNPDFQLSYTGLKNNETVPTWEVKPSFVTDATNKSSVGEYEVDANGGKALNYEVTKYSPGILSILKRDLTVRANDAERLYGEENPVFQVSYSGFANDDSQNDLTSQPTAYCDATKDSNAGQYPIRVEGGSAENYSLKYQPGVLFVNPLTVGFKNVYNTVTFNDMSVSTVDHYFNYVPEIEGPFSMDDFYIDLWFIDGDNKYSNHVYTETSGSYKGNYINTNYDRIMQAGKYIFNLTSKGTNPNVVANPSRCYVTVETASNNLTWDTNSPIVVKVGETVDLGIDYNAYIYCQFKTDYNEEIVNITSSGEVSNDPHWYATGLKEGETTMDFRITCLKNDLGFYDFYDSRTLSKKIRVVPADADVNALEADNLLVRVVEHKINFINKPDEMPVYVFDLNGALIHETFDSTIENLQKGIYIVRVGTKTIKVAL